MRITRTRICLAGLICTVALAFVPLSAAEEGRADDQLLVVIYSIADLPVWSINREGMDKISFDPSMLTALITRTIDVVSWEDGGGEGMIGIHETTRSLVVRQTQANHDKIAGLLESLRPDRLEEAVLLPSDANGDKEILGTLKDVFVPHAKTF